MNMQTEEQLEKEYWQQVEAGENRPVIRIQQPDAMFHSVSLPCAVLCGGKVTFQNSDLRGASLKGVLVAKLVRCTLRETELPECSEMLDCDIQ